MSKCYELLYKSYEIKNDIINFYEFSVIQGVHIVHTQIGCVYGYYGSISCILFTSIPAKNNLTLTHKL